MTHLEMPAWRAFWAGGAFWGGSLVFQDGPWARGQLGSRRVGAAICERLTPGMRAFAGAGGLLGGELFLPGGAPLMRIFRGACSGGRGALSGGISPQ